MTTEVVPQQRTTYETKQVLETLAVTKPTVSRREWNHGSGR
jgi:hypothetical protein